MLRTIRVRNRVANANGRPGVQSYHVKITTVSPSTNIKLRSVLQILYQLFTAIFKVPIWLLKEIIFLSHLYRTLINFILMNFLLLLPDNFF